MIGSWEIGSLDKSAQFFAFAEAYLSSSSALCSRLKRLRAPLSTYKPPSYYSSRDIRLSCFSRVQYLRGRRKTNFTIVEKLKARFD